MSVGTDRPSQASGSVWAGLYAEICRRSLTPPARSYEYISAWKMPASSPPCGQAVVPGMEGKVHPILALGWSCLLVANNGRPFLVTERAAFKYVVPQTGHFFSPAAATSSLRATLPLPSLSLYLAPPARRTPVLGPRAGRRSTMIRYRARSPYSSVRDPLRRPSNVPRSPPPSARPRPFSPPSPCCLPALDAPHTTSGPTFPDAPAVMGLGTSPRGTRC